MNQELNGNYLGIMSSLPGLSAMPVTLLADLLKVRMAKPHMKELKVDHSSDPLLNGEKLSSIVNSAAQVKTNLNFDWKKDAI